MAVRKNDATAASALFSTQDVVSITAERSSDKVQEKVARFLHEALNYRLDSSDMDCGPNWFLTATGARQDTQLTGICVSKQHWEYEEREVDVIVDKPQVDVNGMPMVDPETNEGMTEQTIEKETELVRDRLMITLVPPELAFIDQTADWRDPIQEGGYFIAPGRCARKTLRTCWPRSPAAREWAAALGAPTSTSRRSPRPGAPKTVGPRLSGAPVRTASIATRAGLPTRTAK